MLGSTAYKNKKCIAKPLTYYTHSPSKWKYIKDPTNYVVFILQINSAKSGQTEWDHIEQGKMEEYEIR